MSKIRRGVNPCLEKIHPNLRAQASLKAASGFFRCASISTGYLVRFPNCHECQLGFQYPKKWEIGKEWPVVEKITLR